MPVWSWFFIIAGFAAVVLIVLIGVAWARRRRATAQLKARFGPEYAHTVDDIGDQRAAENELADRAQRRDELDIHPLTPEQHDKFAARWRSVQTAFIDNPSAALNDAEHLVTEVMHEQGYPVEDFDQRAADVSVDHPTVVGSYRRAHRIYLDQHNGEVDTEHQRDAFVHYRALFEQLLEVPTGAEPTTDTHKPEESRS